MPSSGPSFLWKVQRALDDLLHTPMLPPPPPPPTVELADIATSPRSGWQGLAVDVSANTASDAKGKGIESPSSASLNTSTWSSIELDPGRAAQVREMIAAATRDDL